jgi:hypothetical protein
VWNPNCQIERMAKPNSTESLSSSLGFTEPICDLDLSPVYLVAILLTGNTHRAEETLTRAIKAMDLTAGTSHGLFERTIKAATDMEASFEGADFTAEVLGLLLPPPELQDVANLPTKLRQPFVLRVLLAMSRDSIARFLDLDASAVDRTIGLAAQTLTRWSLTRSRTVN